MALPRNFITGMLIFCVFLVAGVFLVIDFGLNNSQVQEFNETFYVINDITEQVGLIRNSTTQVETDYGAFGVLNSLINSAWTGLQILFSTSTLFEAIVTDSANYLGLPSGVFVIVSLISSIVVVFISFAIWSAVFQRDL